MRVEIYVDVLCPWCYIGRRRVAAALADMAERDRLEIVWRSFELAPDASRTPGQSAAEALVEWWGEQAPARAARIRAVGAAEGLDLDLHAARPVNTFDAHRLSHLAARHGLADQAMERLFRAYHTEGRNVADHTVLEHLGVETGLDADEVREMLAGDAYAAEVRADERRAAELGVTGVPTLVIDGAPRFSGVQPPAVLRELLERGLARETVSG
ncbi:DsbA family oxidoreductase [Nonomuraea sp. NPDC003804]|uniref:DsbA family oxidoreductase n=1 Tax=Nonomuraea sp. NPDC003804 TaxID=3154547 RepID=UPI00339E66A1